MIIILKGNTRWWVGKQGTCIACGTIIQLEETDAPTNCRTIACGHGVTVNCPQCTTPIVIPKESSQP